MLRPLTIVLAITAFLGQAAFVTEALARGGAAHTIGQVYNYQFNAAPGAHPAFQAAPFRGPFGFHAIRNGRFPNGVVVGYPYEWLDDFLPNGDLLPQQGCVLERRPVSTLYGLGWRTFNVCFN